MNKFIATCLEARVHAFDARTQHPAKGFAAAAPVALAGGATAWGAAHLPQDRDVAAVHAGDGSLSLLRYRYPDQRRLKVCGALFACMSLGSVGTCFWRAGVLWGRLLSGYLLIGA